MLTPAEAGISFSLRRDEPPAVKDGSKPPAAASKLTPMNIMVVASSQAGGTEPLNLSPQPWALNCHDTPPAGSLPMELAVRLEDLKCEPCKLSAKVILDCKRKGEVLASFSPGRFCVPTDT